MVEWKGQGGDYHASADIYIYMTYPCTTTWCRSTQVDFEKSERQERGQDTIKHSPPLISARANHAARVTYGEVQRRIK